MKLYVTNEQFVDIKEILLKLDMKIVSISDVIGRLCLYCLCNRKSDFEPKRAMAGIETEVIIEER